MASVTGTFTAANQISGTFYLRPTETVAIVVDQTGGGSWSVALHAILGTPPGFAFTTLQTFTSDTSTATYVNETGKDQYLRLICTAYAGSGIAYELSDVAGDQVLQEWVAADGTVVARMTDQGLRQFVNAPVSIADEGAMGDGVTDNTAAIRATLVAADGAPVYVPDGIFVVDTIALSGVNVRLFGTGTLKHKASATGRMLDLTGSSTTEFRADGITFDGNRTNQSSRTELVRLNGVVQAVIERCHFKSSVAYALALQGDLGQVMVDGCRFTDMAEHGGTINQTAFAIYLVANGATQVTVKHCQVVGNVPSTPTLSSGAFFVSVTGSAPCDFLYNYFENVGHLFASNPTGCIDAYTNAGRMNVSGNRAVMSYNTPFKLQIGDEMLATGNRIEELASNTITVAFAILQNVRSYAGVLKYAVVADNFIDCGSGVDAAAFYCAGVDAYHSDGLILRNNVVSRAGRLALLERVAYADLIGNIADGLTGGGGTVSGGVVISDTNQGAGAPSVAVLRIAGGRISTTSGGGVAVFARTNVTNLEVTVRDVTFPTWDTGNPAVTVWDARSAVVDNNEFRAADTHLALKNLGYARVNGNRGSTSGTLTLSTGLDELDYGFNPAWDFTGAKTFDPGSIASGSREVTTVTVTGAGFGTHEAMAKFSEPLQGIILSSWMSGANTVSVCFFNPTSGSIDLDSGTLSAMAIRRVAYDT